ncbi:nuclear autoantigenic sperm protein nasp -related [Holotrichia oblita]|uniref:Nuclear autoantigenic sperm protein nasp -related n=1 Tax=Holotrichia oblita TaxID=644536 RepID=A0ACB9SKW6_HOLOL|nr:nuclear autoantigenic sperm protein nasp -related [Holotrichia oblita]
MADVSDKMEGKTPKQLLGAGARAYATSNYSAAVQYLSRASEMTVAEEGSPTHDSLGEIYFLYGKSLLELSREEGDPLGDVVPKDVAVMQEAEEEEDGTTKEDRGSDDESEENGEGEDDDDDEEEEEGDEEENENQEELNKTEGENNEGTKEDKKSEQNIASATEVQINGEDAKSHKSENDKTATSENAENAEKSKDEVKDDSSEGAKAGSSGSGENEEESASDLQVAWEVLELAKIIFTKRGEEAKPDLAETLITLGEVSLESENFESAVNDIRDGLEIQKLLYDDTDRTLAETYYKLGMALSMNNKIEEAIENFNRTIQLLKNRIEKLKDGQKSIEKKEVDEMRQLIPEIEEKIVDLRNYTEEVRCFQSCKLSLFEPDMQGQMKDKAEV